MSQTGKTYKTEDKLTAIVKSYLSAQPDIKFYKASDRYQKGISDFIICVGGYFVAAELKAEDNVASPHQEIFIEDVQRVGGIGGVCYTLQEVIDLVELARKKVNP